jgi:quercetin dioxygenase-like cupin family protein
MTSQDYCFCDLAPFYALDLLNAAEKAWVEQQVIASPELAEELTTYATVATALPYAEPVLPFNPNLKAKLFDRLELTLPSVRPVAEPVRQPYWAVRSQELDWQPHPVPGVSVAIVHTDRVKREIVGFLRAEPGVHYPWHRHAAVEEIFMLEGDLVVGDHMFGPGDYIHSLPGSSHAPYTQGGCKFFFHTSMDDESPDLAVASVP